jgi:hypothetical protein
VNSSPGVQANLVPDPHLAALTLEHGLTLCSTDGDFALDKPARPVPLFSGWTRVVSQLAASWLTLRPTRASQRVEEEPAFRRCAVNGRRPKRSPKVVRRIVIR